MEKKTLLIVLFTLCVFVVVRGQDNNEDKKQSNEVFYHTVERGQTVYSIAKMYDVKVDDIIRLNVGSDETIRAGEKLLIPQKPEIQQDAYIYHTIQTRETLYGVSKKYGVSGENIMDANPGLTVETFSVGKTIRIPTGKNVKPAAQIVNRTGNKEIYYTVPAKETVYNICRKFKTTQEELLQLNPELEGGLRSGMTLRIPLRIDEKDLPEATEQDPGDVNSMLNNKTEIHKVNATKIALLLPYNANSPQTTDLKKRVTEYYEGLLLAIDSMRNMGCSTELFVYDIGDDGSAKTAQILKDKVDELTNVNLIIGGVSSEQIHLIAAFAQKYKINYVIPFTSQNDDVLTNPYVFQVNTKPTYLYANAAYAGANLFENYNIVILDTKDVDNQADFIKQFKQELKARKIAYKDAIYNEEKFGESILASLSKTSPNMIIPLSSSLDALNKIKTILRSVAETKPDYKITLFGYPVWQSYSKDCLEDFHALDTYIYSLFYADNNNPDVKRFYEKFKNWYSKSPMSWFPKYAMLGFDTGMFFLGAIRNYGTNFEQRLSEIKYKSIQTGFHFERVNNWGGFMNTNVYIIHYNKNFTITRSDFK